MNASTLALSFAVFMLLLSPTVYSQVEVDITAKEVDEIKGTLRVRDLVVNDEARVYGGSLCIKDGKLYLPDNVILSSDPVDDWGIDLQITVLPAGRVRAETVMPNTDNLKRVTDSIEGFLSSNLMPGILFNDSPYCEERRGTDATGQRIRYLEIESIDGLHSLRKVYENLLNKANE